LLLGTGEGDTAAAVVDRVESNQLAIGVTLLVITISPLVVGCSWAGATSACVRPMRR